MADYISDSSGRSGRSVGKLLQRLMGFPVDQEDEIPVQTESDGGQADAGEAGWSAGKLMQRLMGFRDKYPQGNAGGVTDPNSVRTTGGGANEQPIGGPLETMHQPPIGGPMATMHTPGQYAAPGSLLQAPAANTPAPNEDIAKWLAGFSQQPKGPSALDALHSQPLPPVQEPSPYPLTAIIGHKAPTPMPANYRVPSYAFPSGVADAVNGRREMAWDKDQSDRDMIDRAVAMEPEHEALKYQQDMYKGDMDARRKMAIGEDAAKFGAQAKLAETTDQMPIDLEKDQKAGLIKNSLLMDPNAQAAANAASQRTIAEERAKNEGIVEAAQAKGAAGTKPDAATVRAMRAMEEAQPILMRLMSTFGPDPSNSIVNWLYNKGKSSVYNSGMAVGGENDKTKRQLGTQLSGLLQVLGATPYAAASRAFPFIKQAQLHLADPSGTDAFNYENVKSLYDNWDDMHNVLTYAIQHPGVSLDEIRGMMATKHPELAPFTSPNSAAKGAATVRMRAPNGAIKDVPANEIPHYTSRGAVRVQ